MRTEIEKRVAEAVERGIAAAAPGSWRSGNDEVRWDGKDVNVYYVHNRVFSYRKSDGAWWLDTCGWPTSTTRSRMTAALNGAGVELAVSMAGGQLTLRDPETGKKIRCGRGTSSEIARANLAGAKGIIGA